MPRTRITSCFSINPRNTMASIVSPFTDIRDPKSVPFDRIFLDPNNPRIAEEDPPGYEDASKLFDPGQQAALEARVRKVYTSVEALEDSIVKQGWIPIDPIIVWEHPKKKGYYIVVEGNTRTVTLRRLRGERLEQERKTLAKLQASGNAAKHVKEAQEKLVASLEIIVANTNELQVFPFAADTAEELERRLPRLLGVRHIAHVQQWQPYATNLYILSLYEKLFRERYGKDKELVLETPLVKEVANMVSRKDTVTRRNIQSAAAFSDFKRRFAHRLPDNESFRDRDHYFFEQIIQSRFTQDQFEFNKDSLELSEEGAEALFEWAFSKPRGKSEDDEDETDNPNVLYKAESVGLWSKMHSYDAKHGTSFAGQLDSGDPGKATPIRAVEAQYLAHKARRSPIDTLESLRKALLDLKVETFLAQRDHLLPILEDISEKVTLYKKMMEVAVI